MHQQRAIINIFKRYSSTNKTTNIIANTNPQKYGSKIRAREFLASSYGVNMPEYLSYAANPNLKVVESIKSKDLQEVAGTFRSVIDKHFNTYSAILFKRFPIECEGDFNTFVNYTNYKQMEYIAGSASRENVVDRIYEASNETASVSMEPHNEMSYLKNFPKKILFYCIIPPTVDGETVVCFNREILPRLNKRFVSKVRDKKIRYIRNYGNKEHTSFMTWQTIFNTDSCEKVEIILQNIDAEWKWNFDGTLTAWYIGEPFITDPISGEEIWFNQITLAHNSYYLEHPDFCNIPNLKKHHIPSHSTYGDGEEVESEYIIHHREVHWKLAVGIKWEKGDILVLNNLLAQHGRVSYEGERKLVVSLLNE